MNFISISFKNGCHPNPIDELHDFSRWLLHHQPIYIDPENQQATKF